MDKLMLHDEIKDILTANGNAWMTTGEITAAVNERGLCRKGDGSPFKSNQISARIRRPTYSRIFETARTVRLSSNE